MPTPFPPELEPQVAAHMAAGMDEAAARSKAVADHVMGILHGAPPPTTPPAFPFAGPTVSGGLPPVPPRGMSARGKGLAIGGGIAAATALGAGAYHALKGDDERTAAYVEGYASTCEKLAVSIPWVAQHAGSGALKRIKHFDDGRAVHHSAMRAMEAKNKLPFGDPAWAKLNALTNGIEDARIEYSRQLANW